MNTHSHLKRKENEHTTCWKLTTMLLLIKQIIKHTLTLEKEKKKMKDYNVFIDKQIIKRKIVMDTKL